MPPEPRRNLSNGQNQTSQQNFHRGTYYGQDSGQQQLAAYPSAPASTSDMSIQAAPRKDQHIPNGHISSQTEPTIRVGQITRGQAGRYYGNVNDEPSRAPKPNIASDDGQTNRNHSVHTADLSRHDLWGWISCLERPDADATIVEHVTSFLIRADSFVDRFYENRVYRSGIAPESLPKVNFSPIIATHMLEAYLKQADNQTVLIKHILVTRLLDLIVFDKRSMSESLLPEEFRNHSMLAGARINDGSGSLEDPYSHSALSAHRVLTAYVTRKTNNYNGSMYARQLPVGKLLAFFDGAFAYWRKQDQDSNGLFAEFGELLSMTRALGIRLFSQPAVYTFNWEVTPSEFPRQYIPIWPRLLKVVDDHGQRLNVPQNLAAMRFGSISNQSPRNDAKPGKIPGRTSNESIDGGLDQISRDRRIMKDLPVVPAYQDSRDLNQRLDSQQSRDPNLVVSARSENRHNERLPDTIFRDAARYDQSAARPRLQNDCEAGGDSLQDPYSQVIDHGRSITTEFRPLGQAMYTETRYIPDKFHSQYRKPFTGNVDTIPSSSHPQDRGIGMRTHRDIDRAYLFDTNRTQDLLVRTPLNANASLSGQTSSHQHHQYPQSKSVPQPVTSRHNNHIPPPTNEQTRESTSLKSNLPAQYLYYPKASLHTKSSSVPNAQGVARQQQHVRQNSALSPPPTRSILKPSMDIPPAQTGAGPANIEAGGPRNRIVVVPNIQQNLKVNKGKLRKRSPVDGKADDLAQSLERPYV